MNPAILAALLRGTGQLAAKHAVKGTGSTAVKGGLKRITAVLPQIADAIEFVASLRSSQGKKKADSQGDQPDSPAEETLLAKEAELAREREEEAATARQAFQEKFDRGEPIDLQALASVPLSHVPEPLRDFAEQARKDRQRVQKEQEKLGLSPPKVPIDPQRIPKGWDQPPGKYSNTPSQVATAEPADSNYYKGLLESLQGGSKIPPPAKDSQIGRAWEAAKSSMTPAQFVESLKNTKTAPQIPVATPTDSTGLAGMGKGIAGAISDNYFKAILESIQKTGEVPSPERKSSVGRAWQSAKDSMTPEQFVEHLKVSQAAASPNQGDNAPRGWNKGPGNYISFNPPPQIPVAASPRSIAMANRDGVEVRSGAPPVVPALPPGSNYVESRSGAPPVQADSKEQRNRTLRERLSDLIFAQTERRRSRTDGEGGVNDSSNGRWGGAGSGGGGNGPNPPPPGSNPPDDSDDEDSKKAAKSFADRLRDGAAAVVNFLGPIGSAGLAVGGFIKGLDLFNSGIIALNRDLSQFNGALAAAYAQYEIDRVHRSIREGETLQYPLTKLTEEQSKLRDTISELTTPVRAIGMLALAKLTEIANGIIQGVAAGTRIKDLAEMMERYMSEYKDFGGDIYEGLPWQGFFADVADGKLDGKRPQFGRKDGKTMVSEDDRKRIFGE